MFHARYASMRLTCCFAVALASFLGPHALAQTQPQNQQEAKPASLTSAEVARLTAQADAGDAKAQTALGHAYQTGDGVPQNAETAVKWYRKAAEQGDATAENNLGIMYRTGEGVSRDKEEAVKWYAKSAKHGNSQAMFNLGASYYNGDGVGENEFTAYAWFLLAQDAGNPVADDAAKRSAATASKKDTADTYLQISEMYEKGDELPKDDAQALRWLRRAAKEDSRAKVVLAVHLLRGTEAPQHRAEAFELCKAAATDYPPGMECVGEMYRKGLGTDKNPSEAVKWYQKAAPNNAQAAHELAQMYAAGEGTKANRPEAFMMFFHAAELGSKGALQDALVVWQQMGNEEQRKTADKLRERNLDPTKVIAALQKQAS